MKNLLTIALIAVCLMAGAQIQTPSASPAATVTTVVGLTDVKITYSRPRMKGRKIFGEGETFLTPYGKIWRTGANSGTRISFSDDVKIEGIAVPKGEYMILTWPGASEWTVSLYKDVTLGGNTDGYKEENDAAKFKVKSEKLTERVETFTMNIADIADNSQSAKVQIAWENTSVKFTVTVDFDSKVMKSIEEGTKVNPNAYAAAASYYFENGKDLKKALEWMNLAVAANPQAFWNMHTKAKIQKALGDKVGAIATAGLSRAEAQKQNNNDYVKMNDDLIKSLK
jgi:Protein of unknown function (DUF2911)